MNRLPERCYATCQLVKGDTKESDRKNLESAGLQRILKKLRGSDKLIMGITVRP